MLVTMVVSPGTGHSGRRPTPPTRAPLAILSAAAAGIMLVGCVRGAYFLTGFEANCGTEPDADKPCLRSDDPAFSTHPILVGVAAGALWLILLSIPARHLILRRVLAVLVIVGPIISVFEACDTASGYGFVP